MVRLGSWHNYLKQDILRSPPLKACALATNFITPKTVDCCWPECLVSFIDQPDMDWTIISLFIEECIIILYWPKFVACHRRVQMKLWLTHVHLTSNAGSFFKAAIDHCNRLKWVGSYEKIKVVNSDWQIWSCFLVIEVQKPSLNGWEWNLCEVYIKVNCKSLDKLQSTTPGSKNNMAQCRFWPVAASQACRILLTISSTPRPCFTCGAT